LGTGHDARMKPVLALLLAASMLAGCGGGSGSPLPRTPPPPAAATQKPGTYSYATRGFDSVRALVTGRHEYPPRTTVTVSKEGCTLLERWDAFPERWSESRSCIEGDRWRLASLVDYHEFFGESLRERYDCSGELIPRPAQIRTGFRWTDSCRALDGAAALGGTALGGRTLKVGGKRVRTVLLRLRATLRGRVRGLNVVDSWLLRSNGLLVRREVRSDTRVDSAVGTVAGVERYTLRLRSLEPKAPAPPG
jgi:hypothetical protein